MDKGDTNMSPGEISANKRRNLMPVSQPVNILNLLTSLVSQLRVELKVVEDFLISMVAVLISS